MQSPEFFVTSAGRKLAYHQSQGAKPGIVFLGGFKSDMGGTKAMHLEAWAKANNHGYLRFDYSGHGESSGEFTAGCIGDWAEDAAEIIAAASEGPQFIVGSSMGGWISLLLAKKYPDKFLGLVTIAAAPDFTEDSMWAGFDATQRAELASKGQVALPSDYDEPYIITQRLIENGRENLVLRSPLELPFPTRFLQGTADTDVDMSVALGLLAHAQGPDMRLTLIKGADHRFSDDTCLAAIEVAIAEVIAAAP